MTDQNANAEQHACRNCGASTTGRFCSHCGQRAKVGVPSAREFLHEFLLHNFAVEGKVWRTVGTLLFRPGSLTLEYLAGRRGRYVGPLRLYLSASILFFIAARLAVGASAVDIQPMFDDPAGKPRIVAIDMFFGRATREPDGTVICTFPEPICARLVPRLAVELPELYGRVVATLDRVMANLSTAMILLLPVFAALLKLGWWRRTYGEHFLMAMHLHALWFGGLLLTLLPGPPRIGDAVVLAVIACSFVAAYRVYGGPWWSSLLRSTAVTAGYGASLFVAMSALSIWAFLQ